MSAASTETGLYVVHARELINPTLAGHEGSAYTSPPQPRAQALALVAVLLGSATRVRSPRPAAHGRRVDAWSCPIAGGTLQITLTPASGSPIAISPTPAPTPTTHAPNGAR